MLLQKNDRGAYIPGYRLLQPFKEYHSPSRTSDVSEEIYQHLVDGKIVILDLSVGDIGQRDRLSKRIAQQFFESSMATFSRGTQPPHIVIYVEEAHNIIGRDEPLTETWPSIVKEGAKARHRDRVCHAGGFLHPSEHPLQHGKHLRLAPQQRK